MTTHGTRWSPVLVALSLLVLCVFGIALGSAVGSTGFESWLAAMHDDIAWQIVWDIRLPRSVGACAAGALLGHQIGGGTGKDLATIAGAVGGAYAGKKIEERAKTHTVWTVSVQFEDGSKRSYEFAQEPGYRVGDAVKRSGDTISR